MLSDHLCECGCGGFTGVTKVTRSSVGLKKGDPFRFINGHNWRGKRFYRKSEVQYREVKDSAGNRAALHVLRAEAALGKPLPPGAIVHHADGSRFDTAPLVICQDRAYHHLLHVRMRIKAAGGDPNTDKVCSRCKLPKKLDQFQAVASLSRGRFPYCRSCRAEYRRKIGK